MCLSAGVSRDQVGRDSRSPWGILVIKMEAPILGGSQPPQSAPVCSCPFLTAETQQTTLIYRWRPLWPAPHQMRYIYIYILNTYHCAYMSHHILDLHFASVFWWICPVEKGSASGLTMTSRVATPDAPARRRTTSVGRWKRGAWHPRQPRPDSWPKTHGGVVYTCESRVLESKPFKKANKYQKVSKSIQK